MFINISGTWRKVTDGFININGTWRKITDGFVNISGTWRRFWAGGNLAPQFTVTISQATNATTKLITLTGTNYYWSPGPPSLTYKFQFWDGTTWSDMSTGTAINPAYGSSNSYTYSLASTGGNVYVQPNQLNRFRFRVDATYGTQSASSNSSETTVQGPTNIVLTAGDTTTSSIPITWTASTGASRYLVEYKTLTGLTWSEWSWTTATSETILGLSSGTTYSVRVTPYTSNSSTSTYKGYAGNASNTVTPTTKTPPGNLTRVENYNFSGSSVQGFFTTGSNTTKVNYYFNCVSIPSLSVPTYTQNTSSAYPYKIQQNIFSYFTLKTWNADTYSGATTYYLNNTVWYAGNQYRLTTTIYRPTVPYDEIGVSGQVPTNTTYWTRIQTVSYGVGDYVSYNGSYYFCSSSTNGTYPTNTTYWIANQISFQMYATPYNVDAIGTTSAAGSTLIVRADQAATDPLQISSGPTFSNITQTAFRSTFLPSTYTNQVDFYILKTSNSTYVTNYSPRVINVSGATTTTHDTLTTLEAANQYLVTINSRYVYDSTYSVFHNGLGSSGYVTTTAPLPDPPTGLNVSDVGTNRPYSNAAYSMYWTAPSYTGGTLLGYKVQFQIPSVGSTWYDYSANTVDTSTTPTSGSPLVLTGFGSNLATNFRVYSVNSSGQSTSAVATASAITGTTVPQAPNVGTATTFNGYVTVTYTANNTGGKAINSYTATSSPSSITGSASSGSIFVYGLTHNTAYTFTVTATNANGTSLPSSASNTAYGVNVGAPSITSNTINGKNITLGFSPGTNSTATRGYINGSLDGVTTTSSYPFVLPSYSTTYTLGLAGIATVGGTLYQSSTTSGSYTTGAAPIAPSSANTSASTYATSLQVGGVVYVGSLTSTASPTPTYTYQLQYATSAGGTYNNQSGGSTGSYTLQSIDVPNQYFRYQITATNSAGSYTFTTNYVGPTTVPGVAPSNPGTPTGSYSFSGGNYNIAWSWTASTGTAPITYYYSVYSATSNGGALSLRASGSTTATTYSSSWNSTTYGVYGVLKIYAQNAYGRAPSSGTIDSAYT